MSATPKSFGLNLNPTKKKNVKKNHLLFVVSIENVIFFYVIVFCPFQKKNKIFSDYESSGLQL